MLRDQNQLQSIMEVSNESLMLDSNRDASYLAFINNQELERVNNAPPDQLGEDSSDDDDNGDDDGSFLISMPNPEN